MKSILFDSPGFRQIPREQQILRVQSAIREELTELQRYTLVAYYFENRTIQEIAKARGVHKSTVLRTLRRGEARLRRFLKY